VFTIHVGILAVQAFLAKVDLMLHTQIWRFPVGVVDAVAHVFSLKPFPVMHEKLTS
jgi:hypothetical protein